jgi:hypothetical protein
MSQPLEINPIFTPFKRQNSLSSKYKRPNVANSITPEQKNAKIEEFKRNQYRYLRELNKLKHNQYTILKNDVTNEYKVYYFIGRLNPPHNGHIKALTSLIRRAKIDNPHENYKVIILLGSGPGKKQTLNDPLSFDLKRSVVVDLLRRYGIPDFNIDDLIARKKVLIEEMDKAAEQIATEIRIKIFEVERFISDVNKLKVDTIRISGEKDGDVKKLAWIEQSLQKSIGQLLNIQLRTGVNGIAAVVNEGETAMSATQVRKDALRELINLNIQGSFAAKYGQFYGANLGAVYSAIVGQAAELTQVQIQTYIDSGALPKTKKGGSRNRRLTKRRKTKRRKSKKTKRRRLTKRKRRIR